MEFGGLNMNTSLNPIGIVMQALQNFLGNDPVIILSLIGGMFLFIWLYKEISKNIHQREQASLDTLEKRITAYGKLEVSIVKYLQGRGGERNDLEKELFDVFSNSYLELSNNLHRKISKFMTSLANDQLEKSLDLIRKELVQLKLKQSMLAKDSIRDSLFDIIELPSRLFAIVFKPVLIIIVYATFGLTILIVGWFIQGQADLLSSVLIIINALAVIFLFFTFIGIVDMIYGERFRHSMTNWGFIIIYFLLNIVSIIWFYWFSGLIFAVLTAIFIYKVIPRLRLGTEERD